MLGLLTGRLPLIAAAGGLAIIAALSLRLAWITADLSEARQEASDAIASLEAAHLMLQLERDDRVRQSAALSRVIDRERQRARDADQALTEILNATTNHRLPQDGPLRRLLSDRLGPDRLRDGSAAPAGPGVPGD